MFGMSLEARETKLFWRDILGFCSDVPAVPQKFEKKVCVQFLAPSVLYKEISCESALAFLTLEP